MSSTLIACETISLQELSHHNTHESLWVSVHGKVYDLSSFATDHPGGLDPLLESAGSDATEPFDYVGHGADVIKTMSQFQIGKTERSSEIEEPVKKCNSITASYTVSQVSGTQLNFKSAAPLSISLLAIGAYVGIQKADMSFTSFASNLVFFRSFDITAKFENYHVFLASSGFYGLLLVIAMAFLYEQFSRTLNYEKDVWTYPSVISRKTQRTFEPVASLSRLSSTGSRVLDIHSQQ